MGHMHRGPGHQGGKWHPECQCSSLSGELNFYNLPKLSISQSAEVKLALHYISEQLAYHRGIFWVLTQHIMLNWFSRNVKREAFKVSSVTATAPIVQPNLLWESLDACKQPAAWAPYSLSKRCNSFREEHVVKLMRKGRKIWLFWWLMRY